MNILAHSLKNLRVLSLQTGQAVAITGEPVINPDKLELLALRCNVGRSKTEFVLMTRDIRQISRNYVVVDSADEIEEAADIVRLQNILDQKFTLIGTPVATESGAKLGKVKDYTVELDSYLVRKIHTSQPFFKNILTHELIIDRNQVVDVTPKQIIVRDASVSSKAGLWSPSQPIVPE